MGKFFPKRTQTENQPIQKKPELCALTSICYC